MTPQCPNRKTTLVKTKGLQKADRVGFLKEACESIQACGYSGLGHGRTNKMCVEMSSFRSQNHLWSTPEHLSPCSWATLFLDYSFYVLPFLGYNHIGIWAGGQDFLWNIPERTERGNPKQLRTRDRGKTGTRQASATRPHSPGAYQMVVRGEGRVLIRLRKEDMDLIICINTWLHSIRSFERQLVSGYP